MSEPIVLSSLTHNGTRLRLVLNRPKANVLTEEMMKALGQALAAVAGQPHVRLVTIEGAGTEFSFGASVEEHAPGPIERVLPEFHSLIRDLLALPAPTAALVRGRCLGGGFELALACDVLCAEEGAVLGVPEIKLGVFPPAAAALLPPKVGAACAARTILTGEPRPAAEWHAAGLMEMVVPAGGLDEALDRWFSAHLAARSAAALRHAAAAARLALRQQVEPALDAAERLYLRELMRTHDAVEGITAFLEKREPRWRDE